jgi:hypothetical protein
MQFGYAQSASRPPAFPDAPPAILVDSRSVMVSVSLLNLAWWERKYAVVQPMIPPPMVVSQVSLGIWKLVTGFTDDYNVTLLLFSCHDFGQV